MAGQKPRHYPQPQRTRAFGDFRLIISHTLPEKDQAEILWKGLNFSIDSWRLCGIKSIMSQYMINKYCGADSVVLPKGSQLHFLPIGQIFVHF